MAAHCRGPTSWSLVPSGRQSRDPTSPPLDPAACCATFIVCKAELAPPKGYGRAGGCAQPTLSLVPLHTPGWPRPTPAAMLTAPLAPLQAQSTPRAAGQAPPGSLLPLSPQTLGILCPWPQAPAPGRAALLPALLQTPCWHLSLGAIPVHPPAAWGHVGGWRRASVASTHWVGSQGGDGTVLLPGRRSREGALVFGCLALGWGRAAPRPHSTVPAGWGQRCPSARCQHSLTPPRRWHRSPHR